jgi:hypothetical protein
MSRRKQKIYTSLLQQLQDEGLDAWEAAGVLGSSFCGMLLLLDQEQRMKAVSNLVAMLSEVGIDIDQHGRTIVGPTPSVEEVRRGRARH